MVNNILYNNDDNTVRVVKEENVEKKSTIIAYEEITFFQNKNGPIATQSTRNKSLLPTKKHDFSMYARKRI